MSSTNIPRSFLIPPKSGGFKLLESMVISKQFCCFCGSCASFCEHISLEDVPILKNRCPLENPNVISCSQHGTCYDVCPMTQYHMEELEQLFLDGEPRGDLGRLRRALGVRTKIPGQDGGVVSSLLIRGIQEGILDCAIVAQRGEGFRAIPIIAQDPDQIMEAAGSKYLAVPMVKALGDAIKFKRFRKIAIVGTPCQIRGVRKIQATLLRKLPQIEITCLGLFCMENFDYSRLRSKLLELLEVDIDSAQKLGISKGRFWVESMGKLKSCELRQLSDAVRYNCHYCDDFCARLADISIGSMGSPDGFSSVLIRSSKGERLFSLIEPERIEDVDLSEILEGIRIKSRRISKMIEAGAELPPGLAGRS